MFADPAAWASHSSMAKVVPLLVLTCRHMLGWTWGFRHVGVNLSRLHSRASVRPHQEATWCFVVVLSAGMTAPAFEHMSRLGVKCRLCCRMLLVSTGPSGLTQFVDRV